MNYLVVVAHPDDEVLGAGATIYRLIQQGHNVAVAILSGHADARANLSKSLPDDRKAAMEILGVKRAYETNYPNIKMNVVPHLEVVQFIESCILDWRAEAIITHHPSDVNIDHHEVSKAVIAAVRLFQRRTGIQRLRMLAYMEVPSSTDWSLDCSQNRFTPNMFVEVGKEGVDVKIKALSAYEGVMRAFPHPRSVEALTGLAAYRGGQAGLDYAEAFECVFRSVTL